MTEKQTRFWSTTGALLVIAALGAGAFWPVKSWPWPRYMGELMDLAHLPAGFILYLITPMLAPRLARRPLARILALTALLVLMELVQPLVGRSRSLEDAVMGVAGLMAGWLWGGLGYSERSGRGLSLRILAIGLMLGAVCWRGAGLWWLLRQSLTFPELLEMESRLTLQASWRGLGTPKILLLQEAPGGNGEEESAKQSFIRARSGAGRWFGFEFVNPDRSWRGYSQLCLTVRTHTETGEGRLVVRIGDGDSVNYMSSATFERDIDAAWSRHCFSLDQLRSVDGRRLNPERMREILIYMASGEPVRYLDLQSANLQ
ncbi:hypothetical protein EUZ85_19645 [Hahella sp. KA22]|uniref:hypothetical protein n=1 Tax=Hahella sp. KA22 TaxID=1628392 RepID=UPI000FDE316E|nr:hypothetical protein [Hahella sp. KA22]AZZ92819.1 hypothetical protein ENC22_17065 [Hahella sp. KA22]QAY56193.1 hypothetical protein EUZ85_19645 [Hahella sp. KA22]